MTKMKPAAMDVAEVVSKNEVAVVDVVAGGDFEIDAVDDDGCDNAVVVDLDPVEKELIGCMMRTVGANQRFHLGGIPAGERTRTIVLQKAQHSYHFHNLLPGTNVFHVAPRHLQSNQLYLKDGAVMNYPMYEELHIRFRKKTNSMKPNHRNSVLCSGSSPYLVDTSRFPRWY